MCGHRHENQEITGSRRYDAPFCGPYHLSSNKKAIFKASSFFNAVVTNNGEALLV